MAAAGVGATGFLLGLLLLAVKVRRPGLSAAELRRLGIVVKATPDTGRQGIVGLDQPAVGRHVTIRTSTGRHRQDIRME